MTERGPSFWYSFLHPFAWPPYPLRNLPELRHIDPDDPFARKWLSTWSRGYWIEFVFRALTGTMTIVAWLVLVVIGARYGRRIVGPMLVGLPGVVAPFVFIAWMFLAMVLTTIAMRVALGLLGQRLPLVRMLRWFRLRCELRRRGIPVCLACGYEAGDICVFQCPECGAVHPVM